MVPLRDSLRIHSYAFTSGWTVCVVGETNELRDLFIYNCKNTTIRYPSGQQDLESITRGQIRCVLRFMSIQKRKALNRVVATAVYKIVNPLTV